MTDVAVLVPVYRRLTNLHRLLDSYCDSTLMYPAPPGELYLIADDGDDVDEIVDIAGQYEVELIVTAGVSWAAKVNAGYRFTDEPLLFLGADDITFTDGWWLDPLRMFDMGYKVVGSNDTKNPRVWCGQHATHFFVSREYVDTEGACLDGPGVLAPECYRHCYADDEIIQLATARLVWGPCLTSVVPHHHPLFGDAPWDDVYRVGERYLENDRARWDKRFPLIEQQIRKAVA